jgi:excisionase family DNA binding protein
MNAEALLTTREVAAYLSVSYWTVVDWRTKGEGPPAVRAGRRAVRYRRAEVDAWLTSTESKGRRP